MLLRSFPNQAPEYQTMRILRCGESTWPPRLPLRGTRKAVALVATICLSSVSLAFAGTFLAFGPEDFIRGTGKPVKETRLHFESRRNVHTGHPQRRRAREL